MSELVSDEYVVLLGEIKQRIRSGQYEALKAVNKELISLYWDIGKSIVERQEGETWGKSVVGQLAKDLQVEFPGVGGFSAANLWRMRLFYDNYCNDQKLAPLVREISWSKNIIIMEKCKDSLKREFYARMKSTDRNVSMTFKVHPWFLYDVIFQNYNTLLHESTPINFILPLEGV